MSRIYFILTLMPFTLLTAILLLIRTMPYDAHEIRDFLLPESCPAPCLMGIRPGITTIDEAYTILEANPWVGHIEQELSNFGYTIKWKWNDQIPKRIIPISAGLVSAAHTSGKPLVDGITISSFLPLGEVYVVLGPPDIEQMGASEYAVGEQYVYVNYMALYNKERLFLIFDQGCRSGYQEGEFPGLPFTTPVHMVMGSRFTMPASGERITIHSSIHNRPACGS